MKKIYVFLSAVIITQSVFADMMCDTDVPDYYAVYEPNSYTCASGQFLPANAVTCVACPTGGTCPGGTFDFNPDNFQGVIFDSFSDATMNNSCAANFPMGLVAVYEPNTITINWDHADQSDIDANDAGSVTYGGDIRTPRKAQHINGKIFVGWTFNNPSGD